MAAAAASWVIPPFRFATVEEGVYRGAYPTLKNLSFLDTLQRRDDPLILGSAYCISPTPF